MGEPKQPQLAVDPNLAVEQQQAQDSLVKNLQTTAQMDTADLMSRYGTRLALGGAGMSPAATPAAASSPGGLAGMVTSLGMTPTQFMKAVV